MPGTIVILARTRDRRIAIDRNAVFGLAREGSAVKSLSLQPSRPLMIPFETFPEVIADDPIKPAAL